jgi:hypothetical protein
MGPEVDEMRRGVGILIGLALLGAVAVAASPATAFEVRGHDPDDRAAIGGDPDIRSTILRVEPREDGRYLVLVVRAYEELSDWWTIEARLDAQGERRAEHILTLWNADTGGLGCSIHPRRDHDAVRGAFHQNGRAARCRVPIRLVKPDEPIRWKLVSETGYQRGDREVAPNTGMYGS